MKTEVNVVLSHNKGLKKGLSNCGVQIDFCVRQISFHAYLHDGKGLRKVIC